MIFTFENIYLFTFPHGSEFVTNPHLIAHIPDSNKVSLLNVPISIVHQLFVF